MGQLLPVKMLIPLRLFRFLFKNRVIIKQNVQEAMPMLIAEKLRAAVGYTPTDAALAATILADPRAVPGLSMQELADRAHCSHSAVVRLCKKLGFKGYREFTIALIQELNAQTVTIDDANFPFSARDTLREATDKLATLSIGAITNTKERLNMPALVTAVQTLIHAQRIFLYGHGDSSLLVQEFANKLNKIDIYPILADQLGESGWNSTNVTPDDCVLMVSYRSRYRIYAQVLEYMQQRGVPTILITGRPDSDMAQLSTVCLDVSGDEYDYLKMGTIASQVACEYLLTALFAGVYAHDYNGNLAALKQRHASLTTGLLAEDGGKHGQEG